MLFSVTTVCAVRPFSKGQVLSCSSLWLVATKDDFSAVAELTHGIFSPGCATHKSVQLIFVESRALLPSCARVASCNGAWPAETSFENAA